METENKYRGVATLVVVLFIAFFVVLETKLLAGGGSSQTVPGANGYNAGEYTGTGQGNNGEICEPAMEQIPQEIVDAQTYNVDAVSGATMSSKGIMAAVKDAMEQASK